MNPWIMCSLIGATLIIVRGTLFKRLQQLWPVFFRCAQCVGFWVGATAGVLGIMDAGHSRLLNAFLVGTAVSFLALLAEGVLEKLLGDSENEGKG